jgi:hypothetical protein
MKKPTNTMDLDTSALVIQEYATKHNLGIADAITQMSHLSWEDWKHTLKGAPRPYQPKLSHQEENALDCYVLQQWPWRTAALRNGLDISDFVP